MMSRKSPPAVRSPHQADFPGWQKPPGFMMISQIRLLLLLLHAGLCHSKASPARGVSHFRS